MTTYVISNAARSGEYVRGLAGIGVSDTVTDPAAAEVYAAESPAAALDQFAAAYGVTIRYRTANSITDQNLREYSAVTLESTTTPATEE